MPSGATVQIATGSGLVRAGRPPARRRPLPSPNRPRRATRRAAPAWPQKFIAYAAVALIVAVLGYRAQAAAAAPPVAAAPAAPVAPFTGGPAGCVVQDPTGTGGCVTSVTAHALDEIGRVLGGWRRGPVVGSVGCWDRHAWNPTSDHPLGKACDFFPAGGKAGQFASGAALDHGWQLANWLRANAGPLRVHYVIWQGRIWEADYPGDFGGWGHPYDGGGIYNAASATGGHYDHVHASFEA